LPATLADWLILPVLPVLPVLPILPILPILPVLPNYCSSSWGRRP
jgi:hypothetical protein